MDFACDNYLNFNCFVILIIFHKTCPLTAEKTTLLEGNSLAVLYCIVG